MSNIIDFKMIQMNKMLKEGDELFDALIDKMMNSEEGNFFESSEYKRVTGLSDEEKVEECRKSIMELEEQRSVISDIIEMKNLYNEKYGDKLSTAVENDEAERVDRHIHAMKVCMNLFLEDIEEARKETEK